MNSCDNCRNAPYKLGAAGPCRECIGNSQWQNNIGTLSTSSALDTQVAGSHYKEMSIQPVEFITLNKIEFLPGCVIKRMCRWRKKDGVQDLHKAIHEIQLMIEMEERK